MRRPAQRALLLVALSVRRGREQPSAEFLRARLSELRAAQMVGA